MKKRNRISEETSTFIEALARLMEVEDIVLSGYEKLFGDSNGTDMYLKSETSRLFDSLKGALKSEIGDSVFSNLSILDSEEI